ncbi:aspartate/glutamate racemase family protein [Niallia taxi]|uniref:Aspartate/glutamate racemase family protein n=1 Tax=Niallia taxi TaxID=2499688 RepID=A0A3S2TSA6_9BACI|nr:aspartate/glutamate racemase family protein [Niallia taxi]MCM3217431.1 aspartate/glutamate racemase family protein [Niallia taxi]MDK8641374.1 aspartate/glutamate racemase family protein [Niallia taxi]MED4039488.1 aspartate/glutamate racemase family protein [Niallia taxi]MED4055698.1 aspartate/glutamate racemase family protein [Niallia taxi]MED4121360.1 aspartate/glutamate racemase family protein [Niallia taxi]
MKTIGLIGGLSWESTADYYQIINTLVKEELGGLNSAKCLIYSFNMEEMAVLQREGKWEQAAQLMADAAKILEKGGAEVILICTNTMHKVAQEVQEAISVPLIHIAQSTARSITTKGLKKVGLLGTKFTMEQDFYKEVLDQYGIETIIPEACDREDVHSIIFDELCQGKFFPESKERYLEIIRKLCADGAEGIILGCTEIPLLIKDEDIDIPLFNTTYLHSKEAVDFSFGKE